MADDTVCLPGIKDLRSNPYPTSGRCRGNHWLHGGKFNQTSWNSQFWEVTCLILLLACSFRRCLSINGQVQSYQKLSIVNGGNGRFCFSILINTANRLSEFPTGELNFVMSYLLSIFCCSYLLVTSKTIFTNFKYNYTPFIWY